MCSAQRVKCPILSLSKLKMDSKEEKGVQIISWCEDEKVVDLFKHNGDERSNGDEFIESTSVERIKNEKAELDRKDSNLCSKESFYNKRETRTFVKMEVESNNRNYGYESSFKSEAIEQEEVHIKHEEDNEDIINQEKYNEKESSGDESKLVEVSRSRDKKKELDKRKQKAGNQLTLHQCPECPYSTIRKGDLKMHFIRHKKGDNINFYSCLKCPYKTFRKNNLKRHAEIHNNNSLTIKCLQCSYETSRPTNLKRHQIKHKTNIKWLHCSECSFKTHLPCFLEYHLLTHKKDAFKCSKCSYQTRTKGQLTIHELKHESKAKWHSCSFCPYKTYSKKELKRHCLRRHSNDPNNRQQIKIFKCTKCSYENVCKQTVKRHQLIHDRSSWLQCSDCAYKTPYKNSLKIHRMLHPDENNEGWRRGLECSCKEIPCKNNLPHHDIPQKSAVGIRWFECSQCSFKTMYQNSLKVHQLRHKKPHEIDWFCCYECSYKTKYRAYFIRHLSKHKTIDK